jgi:predicted O-methyltransferase YrrM
LIPGKSSVKLVPLLKKLARIDIFLHDSEHSYQNMLWEFQTAWSYLKSGGLLLAHNIDTNDAFSDFGQDHRLKGHLVTNMGGMVKALAHNRSSGTVSVSGQS